MSLVDCDTPTFQRSVCDFFPLSALFGSTETTTPASTRPASWLGRSCCRRGWVSEEGYINALEAAPTWPRGRMHCSVCVCVCVSIIFICVWFFIFFCPPLCSSVDVFRWLTCTRWLQRCGRRGSQRATRNTGAGRGKNSCTPLWSRRWQTSVIRQTARIHVELTQCGWFVAIIIYEFNSVPFGLFPLLFFGPLPSSSTEP